MKRTVVGVLLALLLAAASFAQSPAELRTAETILQFENTANGPRLASLKNRDGVGWRNRSVEMLPENVEIAGQKFKVKWEWNRAASHGDSRTLSFVYDCAEPRLRLSWEWEARAKQGPIEHRITIANLDEREVWLPFVDSLQLNLAIDGRIPLEEFYVEKGENAPSAEGTHLIDIRDGSRWEGTSSTYAHPGQAEAREIIPWMLVERKDGKHSGWYAGIEFSGRTRLTLQRSGSSLRAALGLNPNPGPFRTRLKTGEYFETPTVFLGGTKGGIDAAGNVLRRWVREVLMNPLDWKSANFPLLVNNSWGSGMEIDEALALRMLRDSAELKLEMYHVDAGWFRGVGDWVPDAKRFPHGLLAIVDEAHRLGLKFGLWADWTQAGLSTEPGALNVRDPKVNDWIVAATPADWKPEPFKGQTIDLGVPEAQEWAERETARMVDEYHLDMLEHDGYLVAQGCARADHPHAPPDPANLRIRNAASSFWVESSNETDVSYHATRAYYAVQSALRRNHPGLLLEICNDGGRMVDFGSAAHGDYFSITDAYDPVSNRRAFYDASHLLPPAMLETYVAKWPTPRIENFRFMLRSGMMGWLTIMMDTTSWPEEQHRVAKEQFELYKARLRALIRDAELYHISARPDGIHWDAMEYFDPKRRVGVVYVFRGTIENQNRETFRLKGIRHNQKYRLHFQDGSSPDQEMSGRELTESGLQVSLAIPNSSELIFISEVAR